MVCFLGLFLVAGDIVIKKHNEKTHGSMALSEASSGGSEFIRDGMFIAVLNF